ncbi:hypothetical protein ACEN2S_14990 [Phaeovulum sp. W22_SRMD_FR3]
MTGMRARVTVRVLVTDVPVAVVGVSGMIVVGVIVTDVRVAGLVMPLLIVAFTRAGGRFTRCVPRLPGRHSFGRLGRARGMIRGCGFGVMGHIVPLLCRAISARRTLLHQCAFRGEVPEPIAKRGHAERGPFG